MPKKVLQIYAAAFPEDEMQLELSDKQLSVNNGYYYLCKGKCMYSTERLPGTHIQMNISELTNRILQPLKPIYELDAELNFNARAYTDYAVDLY